jgi:hypothetical protein
MAREARGSAASVSTPYPSKVCKVFEGDTLGLDFGFGLKVLGLGRRFPRRGLVKSLGVSRDSWRR